MSKLLKSFRDGMTKTGCEAELILLEYGDRDISILTLRGL